MTAQNLIKLNPEIQADASRAHLPTELLTGVSQDLPLPTVRAVFDPYEFHRLRYLDDRAPIEHRNASGQWLLDNGFIGVDGRMIVLRGAR